jgi:hypothetical protein
MLSGRAADPIVLGARPKLPRNASRSIESPVTRNARRTGSFGGKLELSILVLNFVYAILGVVLMYVSYRIIDKLTPQVSFPEELKRGNIAVAIFIASLFLAIAIIIGNALS